MENLANVKLSTIASPSNRFLYNAPEKNGGYYFRNPVYNYQMTFKEYLDISNEKNEFNQKEGYPDELLKSRKIYDNTLDTSNIEGLIQLIIKFNN